MIRVYFDVPFSNWTNSSFLNSISRQTPDGSCMWQGLAAVERPDIADFHICFNRPSADLDPKRTIILCSEPPAHFCLRRWNKLDARWKFFARDYYKPQRWHVDKTYEELMNFGPTQNERELSWITSDKGRRCNKIYRSFRRFLIKNDFRKFERKNIPFLDATPYDGHILRMDFLQNLSRKEPGLFDLFGKGDFGQDEYLGEIGDKWDALKNYRYSLAIENNQCPNYFSEKVVDPLLAWCMPIYWGCTNLEMFLPSNSFVRIDIEDPDAPRRIREIVASDRRENNIEAIAEAREIILNHLQIWPTVHRITNELPIQNVECFDNTYSVDHCNLTR